ncbi:hypothetical protein HHK36_001506 [Tetracentron sinense]|uniref:Uncharacterized protein n=1 Tax=Tetracentron sinense TaxID=13715 RepID=A0A834ZU64_TETSI|nr:hypothetical protein HHK36_001506 [Tetracentron sinense]
MEDPEGVLSFDFEGGLDSGPPNLSASVPLIQSDSSAAVAGNSVAGPPATEPAGGNYAGRRSFRQTVCRHWLRSLCMKGDACGFLHQYDKSRMPVCRFFRLYGECREQDCVYKHTNEDIKECNMYKLGFCPNGPDCRYRHAKMPGPPPPVEEVFQKIQHLSSFNYGSSNRFFQHRNAGYNQQTERPQFPQGSNTVNQGMAIKQSTTADSINVQQQQPQVQQSQPQQASQTQMQTLPSGVPNQGNRTASPLPQGLSRYFIVKSCNRENLELSVQQGVWATQRSNEAKLNEAFDSVENVILIFSVNRTRHFQGCAKMTSKIGGFVGGGNWKYAHGTAHYGRNFSVRWLKLPAVETAGGILAVWDKILVEKMNVLLGLYSVMGGTGGGNNHRKFHALLEGIPMSLVSLRKVMGSESSSNEGFTNFTISRDCQELEPSIGEQLASLLYLEPDSELMSVLVGLRVGIKEIQFSFIGKLITYRPVNMGAAKKTLIKAWNAGCPVSPVDLENGFILFRFASGTEMNWVFNHQPWSFNGHPLLMKILYLDILVKELRMVHLPIWKQIYGMPPEYLLFEIGSAIAGRVGELLEVDLPKDGVERGKFLRIRVKVDIYSPLRPFVSLNFVSGEMAIFLVVYERLPTFCFQYGCIGHDNKHCSVLGERLGESLPDNPDGVDLFGSWMRAENFHFESWPLSATLASFFRHRKGRLNPSEKTISRDYRSWRIVRP